MFSQVKDSRLRERKGLGNEVLIKNKKVKYHIFQLQKIIGKLLQVVKTFPSTLKSNTLKRHIFNTLNFVGSLFDNIRSSK